jgi:hypothetical protein
MKVCRFMGYTVLGCSAGVCEAGLSRCGTAGDFAGADGGFAGGDGLERFFAGGVGTSVGAVSHWADGTRQPTSPCAFAYNYARIRRLVRLGLRR